MSKLMSYLKGEPTPKEQYDNEMDRANSEEEQDEISVVHFADSIEGMKQAGDSIDDNRKKYERACGLKKVEPSKTLIVDPKEAQKERNVFIGQLTTFFIEVSAGTLFFVSQKIAFFYSCILAIIVALLVNKFLGAAFSYSIGVSDKEKEKRAEKVLLVAGVIGAFSFCVIILSRWVLKIEFLVALFLGIFFISAAISTIAFTVLRDVYAWARKYFENHSKFTAMFNSWHKVYSSTFLWFNKRPNGMKYLENFLVGRENLLFSLQLAQVKREEELRKLSASYNLPNDITTKTSNTKLRLLPSILLLLTIGLTQTACDGEKMMNSVKAELIASEGKETLHISDNQIVKVLRETPTNAIVGVDLSGVGQEAAQVVNKRVSELPDFVVQHNVKNLVMYPIQQESFTAKAIHNITFDPFPESVKPKEVKQTEVNMIYASNAEEEKVKNEAEARKQTQELIDKHVSKAKDKLSEVETFIPLDKTSSQTDLNGFMRKIIELCSTVQRKVLVLLITDGGFNAKNGDKNTKTLMPVQNLPSNLELVVLLLPEKNVLAGQGVKVFDEKKKEILKAWPFADVRMYDDGNTLTNLFTSKSADTQQ